jgi:hypothetical protein
MAGHRRHSLFVLDGSILGGAFLPFRVVSPPLKQCLIRIVRLNVLRISGPIANSIVILLQLEVVAVRDAAPPLLLTDLRGRLRVELATHVQRGRHCVVHRGVCLQRRHQLVAEVGRLHVAVKGEQLLSVRALRVLRRRDV